jgi:putative flavoprotein involved in K+ transport
MRGTQATERVDTIVIGGGQAGLAVGYHLARRSRDFVILDASPRIGDPWRNRWDSLRLFSPARYDGLPGMPFPASPHYFPTKDEMADFLVHYAETFQLPVRNNSRVESVTRNEGRFMVATADGVFEADNVVVAMANYQEPRIPAFASELRPDIRQIHSSEYRRPGDLRPGRTLIVGAGNSGAEIAMDLARVTDVIVSGRDTGQIPFRIDGFLGRLLLVRLTLRVLFHRILTVDTPIGRAARPKILGAGGPLIRTKNRHMLAAGVQRVPRTTGVRDGFPLLEDGRVVKVENVVWCTGFRPGFERWILLPVHDGHEPRHVRGIVHEQPGLYFVGLEFLRALSSVMVHGLDWDARHVVRDIERRQAAQARHTTHPVSVASG